MGDTNRKYITLPAELNYGDIERVHNTNDWEGEDYSHVKERYAENLSKVEKFAAQVSEWKTIAIYQKDCEGIKVFRQFMRVENDYSQQQLESDLQKMGFDSKRIYINDPTGSPTV